MASPSDETLLLGRSRTRARGGRTPRRGFTLISRAALVILGLLFFVPAGCARRAPAAFQAPERIVWPPPPAPARVEYVGSFRVPSDIGIRRSRLARFFSYLARGRQPAEMVRPFDVAVAPDGRIAVADPDARSVHLFDTERSRYRRIVRTEEGYLASPVGVAFGAEGSLYVADSASGAVHRYDTKGRWDRLLAGKPDLQRPTGLAFDRNAGLLYVVDTGTHRILVFDSEGERIRVIGRRGTDEGEFNYPVALAIGPDGRLFVSDAMNFRVQVLDPLGSPRGSFGRAGMNPGDLDKSKGIAVDRDGHIYLADALHDVVQVFDDSGRLLAVLGGSGTGPGQFWLPTGIHIDSENRILVADSANGRVQILRYLGEGGNGGGS